MSTSQTDHLDWLRERLLSDFLKKFIEDPNLYDFHRHYMGGPWWAVMAYTYNSDGERRGEFVINRLYLPEATVLAQVLNDGRKKHLERSRT